MASFALFEAIDPDKLPFEAYQARLEQYFIAYGVTDGDKKRALLLTSLSAEQYKLLTDLMSPDTPTAKTFAEVCTALKDHYKPEYIEMAETARFNDRKQQPGESVKDYLASLRCIAKNCNFGQYLDRAMRDRFVLGLQSEALKTSLFKERTLTITTAFEKAVAHEAAVNQVDRIRRAEQGASSTGSSLNLLQRSSHPTTRPIRCFRCGENHISPKCTKNYNSLKCSFCKKIGHLEACCQIKSKQGASLSQSSTPRTSHQQLGQSPSRPASGSSGSRQPSDSRPRRANKVHYTEGEEEDGSCSEEEMGCLYDHLFNVHEVSKASEPSRSPPLYQQLSIAGHPVKMLVDTGSPISLIPEETWKQLGKPSLQPSAIRLRTYTGHRVPIMGTFQAVVTIDQTTGPLWVTVTQGSGAALMGRDWLLKRRLNWSALLFTDHDNPKAAKLHPKLKSYKLFAGGLGSVKGHKVGLTLKPGTHLKFVRSRPVPYALQEKVAKQLDKMVEEGSIRPVAHSKGASPIVVVEKPDGSVRICADFKNTLNPLLEVDQHPLPRIEDILASIGALKPSRLTKLDFSQGYLQLHLDEASQELTCINTSKGLYVWNRLPFGVNVAPAVFQKFVEDLLRGLPWVKSYLDDILIVGGATEEEHWERVFMVLDRLEAAGVRLQLSKCLFAQTELEHLGHVIGQDGIKPCPDKVEAIKRLPVPTNVTQLRSGLGLVTYYGKFLPALSSLAYPLNKLLRKDCPWRWGEEEQDAFDAIKNLLSSDKVLCHFSSDLPLLLQVDASSYGVAAVLAHRFPDGSEKPIAYASATLSKAERGWSQLRKEAKSIIFGVTKFHLYLYGRRFELVTDHKPLLGILGPHTAIPTLAAAQMQRWAIILAAYDYDLVFKKTEENGNADALSRFPVPRVSRTPEYPASDYSLNFLSGLPLTFSDLAEATNNDETLSRVKGRLQNGWKKEDREDAALAPFWKRVGELCIEEGVVLWGRRVLVPSSLRRRVVQLLHSDHTGIVKMKGVARSYVWWPGMDADLELAANSCAACRETRNHPPKLTGASWAIPEVPWTRLHADFAGPVEKKMLLIVVDATSKWPIVKTMANTTTEATIRLLRDLFADRGLPLELVTDNGPQFASYEFKQFMERNGIRHLMGAPYHPSTNGLAERMVQTVKKAVQRMTKEAGTLEDKLARFLLSYRNSPHASTGISPAQALTGKPLRCLLDLMQPVTAKPVRKPSRNVNSPPNRFTVGQRVLARDFRPNGNKWMEARVIKQLGRYLYQVQSGEETHKRHVDQMLPMFSPVVLDDCTPSAPVVPQPQVVPNISNQPIAPAVPPVPFPLPPIPLVEQAQEVPLRRSGRATRIDPFLSANYDLNK